MAQTPNPEVPTLVAIGLASEAGAPVLPVPSADLVPGTGIPEDRYGRGGGTWRDCPDREVTLVEEETAAAAGIADALLLRRNLVTRGIDLRTLVGRRFRIGLAVLEGVCPCDPCGYLESRVAPGLKARLGGWGGLRARVIVGGRIGVGDPVTPVE